MNAIVDRDIAAEIARALSYPSPFGDGSMIVTPLLFPSSARAVVLIKKSADGYFVSDLGAGRREADLMNGARLFGSIATAMAKRYEVNFDSDMFFEIEVPEEGLTTAVIMIANASKAAVDATWAKLSERRASNQKQELWEVLGEAFEARFIARDFEIRGARSNWIFDAAVKKDSVTTVFELISPNANSVNSAISKFLDVSDLENSAPKRVGVLSDRDRTPHITLLSRNARLISLHSRIDDMRKLAA